MTDDRYELIERIGSGGMATVWRGRDRVLGRPVAVKRLLPHLASDPSAAARFRAEAQSAAVLNHPAVVTVYDTGSDEDGPFIVMELVEGETLADRLAREGRLDPATTARIVAELAEGLDQAHAMGVVHRDVKPSNVILGSDGRVRLTDFGIAGAATGRDDPAAGTLAYLAPEVLAGEPASPTSDVYSLGAVAHEMLSGAPPFEGGSVAELADGVRQGRRTPLEDVPAGMAAAVARAMAPDPGERPRSAGAFAANLVTSTTLPLAGSAPAPPPAGPTAPSEDTTTEVATPPPVARSSPRREWVLPVAAAGVGLALLVAAAMSVAPDPSSPLEDAPTTTVAPTTLPAPTTTEPVTTTTGAPPASPAPSGPEAAAGALRAALGELRPPDFKPKDVREADEGLDRVMTAWEDGDDDLDEHFERLVRRIAELPRSSERDQLFALAARLADTLGLEIRSDDD